jgi:hypothetical protein
MNGCVCGQDTFFHWVFANLPIAEGSKIGFHPTGWTENRKMFLVNHPEILNPGVMYLLER